MTDSFSIKPAETSTTPNNNGTYWITNSESIEGKYEDHPFKSHTDSIIEIVHGVRCEICGKGLMAHMKPIE